MRRTCIILLSVVLMSCSSETPAPNQNATKSCVDVSSGPVSLDGAEVTLGSPQGYPEEFTRVTTLAPFDIDRTEVTNAQFEKFILATGYVTTAETRQPGFNKAGGAVFTLPSPTHPNWWRFVEGANWRHPEGPGSSINGRESEPVVQVSLIDAQAYAAWAGRALPTEAQWEYAAKAGSQTLYVWGNERAPEGEEQANTWQGAFPVQNTLTDGFEARAPVGCFPPNAFGLYDMIGNVWEWTTSPYARSAQELESINAAITETDLKDYTIKGGSFLCAQNYCARYRAPARQSQERDFSTNHIGFRTVSQTAEGP